MEATVEISRTFVIKSNPPVKGVGVGRVVREKCWVAEASEELVCLPRVHACRWKTFARGLRKLNLWVFVRWRLSCRPWIAGCTALKSSWMLPQSKHYNCCKYFHPKFITLFLSPGRGPLLTALYVAKTKRWRSCRAALKTSESRLKSTRLT